MSDEFLIEEQGHWADVIGRALIKEDIVIRRRIVAGAVVKCCECGERREWICKTTAPCRKRKAGSRVVIDKPDHAADRD